MVQFAPYGLAIILAIGLMYTLVRYRCAYMDGWRKGRREWQEPMLAVLADGISEIFPDDAGDLTTNVEKRPEKPFKRKYPERVTWTVSAELLGYDGPFKSGQWEKRVWVIADLGKGVRDPEAIRIFGRNRLEEPERFSAVQLLGALKEIRKLRAQLAEEQAELDKRRQTA